MTTFRVGTKLRFKNNPNLICELKGFNWDSDQALIGCPGGAYIWYSLEFLEAYAEVIEAPKSLKQIGQPISFEEIEVGDVYSIKNCSFKVINKTQDYVEVVGTYFQHRIPEDDFNNKTLAERIFQGTGELNLKPTEGGNSAASNITPFDFSEVKAAACSHYWKNYVGLNESFVYCEKCDKKKEDKYD